MLSYLNIYRPANLILIGLSQLFCGYFLDRQASITSLLENGIHWLLIGTLSCAAFGNWINDFFDQYRDSLNQKKTSYIHTLSRSLVILHFVVFVLGVIFAGYALNTWFFVLFISTIFSLLIYSWRLKDLPLIGNLVISILGFYSIYSLRFFSPSIDTYLVLHYSIFSGLLTLCREIIKDAEDVKGDRESGSKTLPILLGFKTTNMVIYGILLILISLMIISYYYQSYYFHGYLTYIFYGYCILFIIIPLYKLAVDVRYIQSKEEYSSMSQLLKYVIFTGILSILFF